ncbi:MAG: tetratricopeptide repeat protein [Chitinophagales bacterium]|nr:tetratricopeptide repeat protein [Chitinophagales bacterium]
MMKRKLFFYYGLLVSVWVAFSSCSALKPASADSSQHGSLSQNKINPSIASRTPKEIDPATLASQEKFIEAMKMKMLGENQQALNLFKECIKIDPNNAAAFYNAAKIFYDQKQYGDALAFAAQAGKLNPQNEWYLDLYSTLLGGTGNYKEAIRIYDQMLQLDPDNSMAWYNKAFFLDQNNQTEESIKIFNQIEEKFGVNEDVINEKVKLWLKLNKADKAAAELQKLINNNPDDLRNYSRLVDFYLANKMDDKAYQVLQEMIKIDPDDPRSNLVLATYYSRKGEDEKSFESLKKAFASPDLDIDVKIPALLSYIPYLQKDGKKKQEALELGKELVNAHLNDAKAHAIYGDILNQLDQFGDAITEYKKSVAIDNSKFAVWQQIMYLNDRINNYDSLLVISNRAIELFPDQILAFYFNGYANMQLKKYNETITAIGKAIQIGSDDKKQIAGFYSVIGDAYYYLKNNQASDSSYDLALVFDPENAYVLNNYSYFLSVRDEKLTIAKSMAEKANMLVPDSPAYEDTYGWVLYKTGDFQEAKTWLDKALKNGGDQDGTILEHYGNVLYKLGETNGAVQYWLKAKDKHVDSDTIDKKIAEQKLFE